MAELEMKGKFETQMPAVQWMKRTEEKGDNREELRKCVPILWPLVWSVYVSYMINLHQYWGESVVSQ